jgi:CDP-glucose 4,6-dehydratase
VLEAVSHTDSVQAHLVITTDKVYRNLNRVEGYRENESLGGSDPYSASKSMADILIQSWTQSFPGPPTAIARAGNVIGGGDVSKDRLLPDLMRAFSENRPALIRFPAAVRPWQHVLDCLNGYLILVNRLLSDRVNLGPWNFGPEPTSITDVESVAHSAARLWGPQASLEVSQADQVEEAKLLVLDSSKAREELHWFDRLNLDTAIEWTVSWAKSVASGEPPLRVSLEQVRTFSRLNRG